MFPPAPLLATTATNGRSFLAAVSSSIAPNPNEPSPMHMTTGRSGAAAFDPSAYGTATPIVPSASCVCRYEPGWYAGNVVIAQVCESPPSETRIASRPAALITSLTTRPGGTGDPSPPVMPSH